MVTARGRRWGAAAAPIVGAVGIDLMLASTQRQLRWGPSLAWWVLPLASAVVFSTLLMRRRHPVAVLGLQCSYAVAAGLLAGYPSMAGLLIALYAVASCGRARLARLAWVVGGVPLAIDGYLGTLGGAGSPAVVRLAAAAAGLAVAGAVGLAGRSDAVDGWASTRPPGTQAEATAVATERVRLARDLHDVVAHSVSAMVLQAAGAATLVGPQQPRLRQSLTMIENAGVAAMVELQRLLALLRRVDPEPDDPRYDEQLGVADIDGVIERARRAGVVVESIRQGAPVPLDRSVELAGYRVVQEALANTTEHAGRGADARVHLRWHPDGLTITVRDTAGLPSPRPRARASAGRGILRLTERIEVVGGRLAAGPVPGGFLVQADLPVGAQSRFATAEQTS